MKPCTILISNFNGHEAIELCIESLLYRTIYPEYRILVMDSSPKDSRDRTYLTELQRQRKIELFTSDVQMRHASAITRLLRECKTPLACLMDSDVEVLRGEWLKVLVDELKSPNDLGVARLKASGVYPDRRATAPVYQPFCMLLNMNNYRKIADRLSWQEKAIPLEEYKGRHTYPENVKKKIYGDVGWQLAEKVLFDNPTGLVMQKMPEKYMLNYIRHYGGLSVHHASPGHPRMKHRWVLCRMRLKALRANR